MYEVECVGKRKDEYGLVIKVDIVVLCTTFIVHDLGISMRNCS